MSAVTHYNNDAVFTSLVDSYNNGETKLQTLLDYAMDAGILPIRGENGEIEFHKAVVDSYKEKALLMPYKLSDAINAGNFPAWIEYDRKKSYFKVTDSAFCDAFIKAYDLKKNAGAFFSRGEPITVEKLQELVSDSLSLVRESSGQKIYSIISTLHVKCKDESPKATRKTLTIQSLGIILDRIGVSVRHNMITQEYDVKGKTEKGRDMNRDDLITTLHSNLSDEYKGVTFDTLQQYVAFVARENEYNPVIEKLQSVSWDGYERICKVYDLLGIAPDDNLSRSLIRKWLFQCVALLFNDISEPFGADGILVLNGPQGLGKTSLFRRLALCPEWFKEGGSIDDRDKDTSRRVITTWICELGEVANTLKKSDLDGFKAFVTQSVDSYRLPYGRNDITTPRRSSLCATCNDEKFLIDPTGSRRWWTIPVEKKIKVSELVEFDALQLWAQIYEEIEPLSQREKASCFRLNDAEIEALANRNCQFEKPLSAQEEIEDIIEKARTDSLIFKEMTVTEFKDNWPALSRYTANQVGTALKKLNFQARRTKKSRFYELPIPFSADQPFSIVKEK